VGDNEDLSKILGYPIHARTHDGLYRPIMIDKKSRSLVVLDAHTHCNHLGKSYLASASTLVNTGGKIGIRLQASCEVHLKLEFSASLHAVLRTWFPSISGHAPGNELPVLNRNMVYAGSDSYATGLSLCHTPTTADTDSPVRKIYMGSAGRGANLGIGGHIEQAEIILNAGVAPIYIELESLVDGNSLSHFLWWSEGEEYS